MQLNNSRLVGTGFTAKAKALPLAAAFVVLSLLAAACGDNTATSNPPTVAATTAPAATKAAATTAAATTAAATTAALTTGAATTAALTSAASTTTASTTSAMTSAAATTASVTTAPAASGISSGQAKVSLANATVQAGTTIDVSGEGFPTNSWVTIQFGPGATARQVASLALTDNAGKFKVPLILSSYGDGSKIEPGNNIIQAITQDGKVMASLNFNIIPGAATATPNS